MAAAKRIEYIIYKVEQLINKPTGIGFHFLSKVNHHAIDAVAACPKFILHYQRLAVIDEV